METLPMNGTLRFPCVPLLPNMRSSDLYDIELTLTLKDTEDGPALLVHTTLTPSGSHDAMLSTQASGIAVGMLRGAYPDDPYVEELTRLVAAYDRNHMHPGTERQEAAVKDAVEKGKLRQITQTGIACYLKSIRLYVDDSVRDADGSPHRYGHGWVYTGIPEDDMQKIADIISGRYMPQGADAPAGNDTI